MKDEVQLKKYLPSLIFAIILPVIAYLFLKMLGNSDTLALGIATAFPVVHMLWSLIRKKELDYLFALKVFYDKLPHQYQYRKQSSR